MIAVMIAMAVMFAAVMAYVVYTMKETNKCIGVMIDNMKDIADSEGKKYSEIRCMRQSVGALLSIEMSAVREAAKGQSAGRRK